MKSKLVALTLAATLFAPAASLWASAGDADLVKSPTATTPKKHHGGHHHHKKNMTSSTANTTATPNPSTPK